jgi:hypothetical protein
MDGLAQLVAGMKFNAKISLSSQLRTLNLKEEKIPENTIKKNLEGQDLDGS